MCVGPFPETEILVWLTDLVDDEKGCMDFLNTLDKERLKALCAAIGEDTYDVKNDAQSLKELVARGKGRENNALSRDASREYIDYVKNIAKLAYISNRCDSDKGLRKKSNKRPTKVAGVAHYRVLTSTLSKKCNVKVVGKSSGGSYVILEVIENGQKSTAFVNKDCLEKHSDVNVDYQCPPIFLIAAANFTSKDWREL